MNDFTASNGVKITRNGDALSMVTPPDGYYGERAVALTSEATAALADFFRAEEDERLGRWRWPENPNWVCYPTAFGEVVVFDESDPAKDSRVLSRGGDTWPHFRPAADAYFDAHPEPKPWHEAKPWETWLITFDGAQEAVTLDEDREFRDRNAPHNGWAHITDPSITAGRRLWPEVTP